MLIGTPIAFCLGISCFATVVYLGLPPLVVFQRVASGVSVFTLMAIPFFIFAGDLMVRGGIASRIVAFAGSLIGHVRGGLGQVNIAASTLFGGISGSAVAEASAVGGIMIPQMKARGYGADYAVNVTSMAALIALLLPPSHNMIIYSISGGGKISIADLFTAGIIPGLLLALALSITACIVAVRRGYPTEPFPGFRRVGELLRHRDPRPPPDRHHLRRRALRHLHRHGELLRRGDLRAARHAASSTAPSTGASSSTPRMQAVRTTSMVLLIIGMAGAFGWLMAYLKVAQMTVDMMGAICREPADHPPDDQRHPAGARHLHGHGAADHHHHADLPAGGHRLRRRSGAFRRHHDPQPRHRPQHPAARRRCSSSPPPSARSPIWEAMRTIWPFYGAGIVVLLLVTYIPALSLWLPSLFH